MGSVFSPYYAWAGRRAPENHCAINVALYGPRGASWTMTERGAVALTREAGALAVGPSAMRWTGEGLIIDIDEIAAPIPWRVRGRVRIAPEAISSTVYPLAPRHWWRPIATRAAVTVEMEAPALSWRGDGYLDCNWGDEPLEAGFRAWTWSRAHLKDGAAVLYESLRRDGSVEALALRFDRAGAAAPFAAPAPWTLPRGFWGVGRTTRAQGAPRLVRTLEDAPFYTRSQLATRLLGEDCTAVHESLDLDRFSSPVVKLMLPFRMPRLA